MGAPRPRPRTRRGGIAKSTKVLVDANPKSLSGEATKVQAYGVPVITEDAFDRLLTS